VGEAEGHGMTDLLLSPVLLSNVTCGLLGLATGIFTVLSLVEKPTWALMWNSAAPHVPDEAARAVHAILKRVIHMLPPTMITTMLVVSILIGFQMWRTDFATAPVVVGLVFFPQLVSVVIPLFPAIRGVDDVSSGGEIQLVRSGLGTLARVHHQGLAMVSSTLVAQWVLVVAS